MNQPLFEIRPAYPEEADSIKSLVHAEHLNPIGLRWTRFTVAANSQRELLGCVQQKNHFDGSQELASLVVHPKWRRRGVASALIRSLQTSVDGSLYLFCRSSLQSFYQRFGFAVLAAPQMPPYFRLMHILIQSFRGLMPLEARVVIMGNRHKANY